MLVTQSICLYWSEILLAAYSTIKSILKVAKTDFFKCEYKQADLQKNLDCIIKVIPMEIPTNVSPAKSKIF